MYEEPTRTATEAEAHAEWHWNAGVPMGTPGCPWDACHDEPDEGLVFTLSDLNEQVAAASAIGSLDGPFAAKLEDDDDLPF